MSTQAIGLALAGGLLMSTLVSAQPIDDLQNRLTAMRNDQKTRIEVEIELRHRGTAPLHWNKEKKRGVAIIDYGSRGIEKIERRNLGSSFRFSAWKKQEWEKEPLLEDTEALDLVNPAAMMESLLREATLLSDEPVTWQGRPARLLVIRPALPKDPNVPEEGGPIPFAAEAKVWLDESGVPLAMERSVDLRLGSVVSMTENQAFTFQQVGGRLLVAEARETWSGTGLAVMHGRDEKKMKVVAVN